MSTRTPRRLSASINPGFGQTVYRFQYGRDTNYEFRTPPTGPLGDDNVGSPRQSEVTDLLPGVTYHFRVVAINFAGVTQGPDRTFTTHSAPGSSRLGASDITAHGARIDRPGQPGVLADHLPRRVRRRLRQRDSGERRRSAVTDATTAARSIYRGSSAGDHVPLPGRRRQRHRDHDRVRSGPSRRRPEPAIQPSRPACRKGFVKRHGKCVKKPRRHQKRRHRARS